jgi:hypothetical protein
MADDPSIPKANRARWRLTVLVVVLALHAFLAFRLFPSPKAIVDDEPVVMVDHAIHEYHGALGARFLGEAGTTWGVDPFFMAGYPETPVWDSSSNLAILFQSLAGGYSPRAYKLGLLACSLLALGMIPAAAWAAGLGAGEAAAAAAFACFYFWGGYPGGLWRTGLFAFLTASAGVGLVLALCARFDRRPTVPLWLGLTALAAALFFMHVTTPIMLCGGLLAFVAATARRHGGRWIVALVGAAVLVAVINAFWLVPLWRFRGIREGGGFFFTVDTPLFFLGYLLGVDLDGHLAVVLLIVGIAGLIGWAREGRQALAAAVGGGAIWLFLLAAFGSFWGPTRILEPLRFVVPLNLLMALPAGSAAARATGRLARVAGGGVRGATASLAAWLAVLGGVWAAFPITMRTVIQHRPLAVGIAPEMTGLVDWLRSNTDPSARILFEDQLRVLESTDPESTHWAPLLPFLLGRDQRQFIGGLYQTAFIRHRRMAAFGDFQLGDRPMEEWTPDALRGYCDLYNIGWVACWSPLSRFWFDRFEPATRVATLPRHHTPGIGPSADPRPWEAMARRAGPQVATRYMVEGNSQYAIYRLDRPHSFVIRGRARLAAVDFNRIELADVVPHEGSILLSFHWIDGWRTDPPRRIGPEPVPRDPVDFVRIDLPGPVPRLVIFNGYGPSPPAR